MSKQVSKKYNSEVTHVFEERDLTKVEEYLEYGYNLVGTYEKNGIVYILKKPKNYTPTKGSTTKKNIFEGIILLGIGVFILVFSSGLGQRSLLVTQYSIFEEIILFIGIVVTLFGLNKFGNFLPIIGFKKKKKRRI